MAYSDAQIEELRARADIVTLVGRRVALRKAGKDHVGLCPFHGEKTPSFYVVPHKQLWHCFGCGETGDVFKFFMKLDGLGFGQSLELVARESGVILADERQDPEAAARRARQDELAALLERAVKFYEQKLWRPGGLVAREHLASRGIGEEVARRFQLGFGGAGRDELTRALSKAGASVELAAEAGLVVAGSRRTFDRFSTRLIVPIRIPRPPRGRAVALGGRALEGLTPGRDGKKPAKYINSPETPLYQKGSVLFGLDLARDHIRKEDRAVVVEGYFDVIGLHQAGFPLAVATCGTTLTGSHLDLLTRTGAKEVVFLFDGDEAGVHAAVRAGELCAKAQVPAKVATLPAGKDPDELARERGREGLVALVERARPAIEFLVDRALSALGPQATVEERVRAVESVRKVVRAAPVGLSRELYVAQIAERLKVPPEAVREAIDRPEEEKRSSQVQRASEGEAAFASVAPGGPKRSSSPAASVPRTAANRRLAEQTYPSEKHLILALLKFPRALSPRAATRGLLGDFRNPELRRLGEAIIQAQAEGADVSAADLLGVVEDEKLRTCLHSDLRANDDSLEQSTTSFESVADKLLQQNHRARKAEMLSRAGLGELASDGADFLEEQQRQTEENAATHQRIRERNRPG